MAWNYTTLKAAIQNWSENDGTEFAAALDDVIMLAEDRLLREADLDRFRKFSYTNVSVGDRFLTKPNDFLIDRWLIAINGTGQRAHLLPKDNSFFDEYWPDLTLIGLPKFYSDWDEKSFIIIPPPDDTYQVELAYTYRPDGLSSSNANTWVGTNAPRALFGACMVEASIFNKMAKEVVDEWKEYYKDALSGLIQEQMTRQRTSELENGEIR